MNKTIIININGFIFHIEEDAYEILKNYMTDVKRHFLNSADSLEITTDIENRIAEMFTEILAAENKQVIIEQDVKGVVEQMGSVADFETSEDEAKSTLHETHIYGTGNRKLFRDSENHLLAGVCSGLANYFDTQVIWFRLAFAAATPFFGIGIIFYIIFWIVMPKAITRTDRMAMRGQKLNLQGFKENLEEEQSNYRSNMADSRAYTKPAIYKVRDFWGDLFGHIGAFLSGVAKILIKILGVGVILACIGFIVFLVVALVGLIGFGRFRPFDEFPYQILENTYSSPVFFTGFLIGIIPAISIILITFKGIFNVKTVNRQWASWLLIIWLCALGIFTYCGIKIVANFASEASFSETIALTATPSSVYVLKLNDDKYFSAEDSIRLNIKALKPNARIVEEPYEYNDYRRFRYNKVYLSIERSDISQPTLVKSYHSHGRDYDEALSNARDIKYRFLQQDSILKFDYKLYNDEELWHDETLHLTLKLPLNAKVTIDTKLKNLIVNHNVNGCEDINKLADGIPATFIMTENGLQCIIDPAIAKARKRDQKLLDSLRKADEESHEEHGQPDENHDNLTQSAEETRERLKQEAEDTRERLRRRRHEMIDSLENELR
jgi:phage shock protein PspC (stress-responsive transcriptional regulator)